jgi:hypothetical protein
MTLVFAPVLAPAKNLAGRGAGLGSRAEPNRWSWISVAGVLGTLSQQDASFN